MSAKMKLYSDYRSEVLDKEGYMEELEKTTSRILEITLHLTFLQPFSFLCFAAFYAQAFSCRPLPYVRLFWQFL